MEPYSSQGPTRDGRLKPEILGPDCVSVTGNGGFPTTFCGTSAAAPHVAGVAALLLSANPALTPPQVYGMLAAVGFGFTIAPDPYPNNVIGFGLVQAFESAQIARQAPSPGLFVQMTAPGRYEWTTVLDYALPPTGGLPEIHADLFVGYLQPDGFVIITQTMLDVVLSPGVGLPFTTRTESVSGPSGTYLAFFFVAPSGAFQTGNFWSLGRPGTNFGASVWGVAIWGFEAP